MSQDKQQRQLEKLEKQITKMLKKIEKMQPKQQKEENEQDVKFLVNEKESLQNLIHEINTINIQNSEINIKILKNNFNDVKASFKAKKKIYQDASKVAKNQRKQQKKAERDARKAEKEKKKQTLEDARITTLPPNSQSLAQSKILHVFVDGWNIMGCFGGRNRNKKQLIQLLQQFKDRTLGRTINDFIHPKTKEVTVLPPLKLDYQVEMHLYFDGNGQNKQIGDVKISFSGKEIIVDDLWVKMFEESYKKDPKTNINVLVVTSDRELTIRLHQVGVKVMKSGTFFKNYLVAPAPIKVVQEVDDDDDDDDDEDDSVSDEKSGDVIMD